MKEKLKKLQVKGFVADMANVKGKIQSILPLTLRNSLTRQRQPHSHPGRKPRVCQLVAVADDI